MSTALATVDSSPPFPVSGADLPLTTRFSLGKELTSQQREFLKAHGFLVFAGVASPSEVKGILDELDRIEASWLKENRQSVFGIPLFAGKKADGTPLIQRFPFTSCFSDFIKNFVRDERFAPVRQLIGDTTRVGDQEKDGVVINRYLNVPGSVYPRLGWHTDGLRDLFYLKMPKQMLNVGLHFDRCRKGDGGLCLIPGSHTQGFWSMCFRKIYFLSHAPDPKEIFVETEPGDLTVHDGLLWHRVQVSPHTGEKSLRRSMYVPYLTDAFSPKGEGSSTPVYHHLGRFVRWLKLVKDGRA